MDNKELQLREDICRIGQLMQQKGFVDGATAGNISVRLDDERLLITPSGVWKGFMKPEQLIVIDLDGNRVGPGTEANRHLRPTSETPMHTEVMKQRPDVQAVVHAHPTYGTALTLLGVGIDFYRYTLPEAIVLLGDVPTTPYAPPSGTENGEAVREVIRTHDALMLGLHGSLTVGKDLWQAYSRLETLEHAAQVIYLVHAAGGMPDPLPLAEIEKLHQLRRGFNLGYDGELADIKTSKLALAGNGHH